MCTISKIFQGSQIRSQTQEMFVNLNTFQELKSIHKFGTNSRLKKSSKGKKNAHDFRKIANSKTFLEFGTCSPIQKIVHGIEKCL